MTKISDALASEETVGSDVPKMDIPMPARRQLLALGAAAGAATLVAGAMPAHAGFGAKQLGAVFNLDSIVAAFASEMEELSSEFFYRATRSPNFGTLSGREQAVINTIAVQDRQHFEDHQAVLRSLGNRNADAYANSNASASRRPRTFRFGGAFNSRDKFFEEALYIKETILWGYHGAVTLVSSELLMPAAAIAGVDGRHVAVLREIAGVIPVPRSFEEYLTPQAVAKRLDRYGFTGGGRF